MPASIKNAVNTSYVNNEPSTGPTFSAKPAQLAPNWNSITIPNTTPIPNVRANTFVQNLTIAKYLSFFIISQRASKIIKNVDNPILKAGNKIWKLTVNANCILDRISTQYIIDLISYLLLVFMVIQELLKVCFRCNYQEE